MTQEFGKICLEELKIANMTKSAKGTAEQPGKNVKAKAGLNREILNQGWGQFKTFLEYKAKWYGSEVVYVDPKHTSQVCSQCGHKDSESRKRQDKFVCTNCGYSENADINAAKNILTRGLNK